MSFAPQLSAPLKARKISSKMFPCIGSGNSLPGFLNRGVGQRFLQIHHSSRCDVLHAQPERFWNPGILFSKDCLRHLPALLARQRAKFFQYVESAHTQTLPQPSFPRKPTLPFHGWGDLFPVIFRAMSTRWGLSGPAPRWMSPEDCDRQKQEETMRDL